MRWPGRREPEALAKASGPFVLACASGSRAGCHTARPWAGGKLSNLGECRQRSFQEVHLGKGEKKGKSGFGALVAVDAVFLEAVAAAARAWVVHVQTQVVAAQEPFECGACFGEPGVILGDAVSFQASGDCGVGFDRLLVEAGPLGAFAIE